MSRNFLHIGQMKIFLLANDTVICPTKDNQIGIESEVPGLKVAEELWRPDYQRRGR